tara:strand:+ start:181 stop:501 length:321 start_codon:yes stop_codon:yes gene_type:complete
MKITRSRIREIVKETLNKRLAEQEPVEQPAQQPAQQGEEPRQNISSLIKKIIGDGGDDTTIKQLQKMVAPLPPIKKAVVVDAISKAILGIDPGDKHLKQAISNPDE